MAGYSGKPLLQKLGLKPGHRVALPGAPAGFLLELAPLPPTLRVIKGGASTLDCVILFAPKAAPLTKEFARWVAWPKRASKVETDVTEEVVRRTGLSAGLVDIKICAVDEVWSGLKFVRRLADR